MKKYYLILLQIVLSVMLVSSIAFATPVIDGSMGMAEWAGHQTVEDAVGTNGYVGPGWGGQDFDVERIGIYIDSSKLYFGLKTGFDIRNDNTITYGGNAYEGGDFALDFKSDGSFEFGFDWDTSGNVNLYKVSSWTDPYFPSSTPWKMNSYTLLSSGINHQFGQSNDGTDNHYTLEGSVDLSVLSAALQDLYGSGYNIHSVTAHWTMSCGNDVLDNTFSPASPDSPVPEPATLLLFGMGLLGAGAYGRKKSKKQNS